MSEYRALYRKWRPSDFDEVSGQNAITDILKYEVANGRLSHAYLFSGSRGTGKTSCAKILAKAVNCENSKDGNPCNKCEACRSIDMGIATDVIEMDAASNNGVDNVRDMKDEIAFTPAVLKYRVYIIDEVHMMSSSAFNALLKTLEEPPTYVIFILATTEYHKLPTTIVSRCQRFDFKRISGEDITARLKLIAKDEGISLTDDGARVIARVSRGGMRDAISLLELCAGAGRTVDETLVFETVGSGNRDGAYKLIRALLNKDYDTVYSTVDRVVSNSGDLSVFWQELIDSYRDILVVRNTDRAKEYLDLTDSEYMALKELASGFTPAALAYHVSLLEGALSDMQRAFNSKRSIAEIALTRMCDAKTVITPEALALRVEELERNISMLKMGVGTAAAATLPAENGVKVLPAKKEQPKTEPKATETKAAPDKKSADTSEKKTEVFTKWKSVIERIGELKSSLSVQFLNSSAFKLKDGNYLIKMNSFFVERLLGNNDDIAILKGVIAEKDKRDKDAFELFIKPQNAALPSDLLQEIEEAINNAT